jgi:ABC-type cobalamin transport system permease subunit
MTWILPGVWYASYAIGLFSSRAMLPRTVVLVGVAFGLAGAALMLTLDTSLPLRFWVMPLGFGFGQMFIGYLLTQDRKAET